VELNLWTRRLKPLNAALEAIRDVAVNALTQIDQSQETRGVGLTKSYVENSEDQ